MSDNTNSAHERTASIDLDKQEQTERYGTGVLPWSCRIPPNQPANVIADAMQAELNDLRPLVAAARRSLTSGAPAEDGCGCQQGQCCNVCDPIHDGTAPISGKASEVKVWLKAETASREAIKAYNAAVAESDRHIWPGTDINAEFQIMSAAKNKAFQAMHAMYDAMSGGAAAKTEQAHVIGGQRWSKEDEMMESWVATAAGAGSAQQADTKGAALDERALFNEWLSKPVDEEWTTFTIWRGGFRAAIAQQAAPEAPSRDAGQEEASTQTVPDGAAGTVEKDAALLASKRFLEDMHMMPIDWTINESQILHAQVSAAIEAHNKAGKEQG